MGKKAQRGLSVPEKGSASWVRSFISIFDFGQSHNLHKLLTDRRCRSARYSGTSSLDNNFSNSTCDRKYEHDANENGCEDTIILSRLPSIKSLIDEEMSKERTSKDFKLNQKISKNHENGSDPLIINLLDSAYLILDQLKCRKQVEGSNLIFDLATLMIEFYSVIRKRSDICEETDVDLCASLGSSGHIEHKNLDKNLHEALIVEAEAFLSQKIDDTKRLVGNGIIHSQEFMDTLEILNSNKELFIELFQDPNSLVFSHIQELLKPQFADFSKLEAVHCLEEKLGNLDQNGESISNVMFQKQKKRFLSKKKDKFQGDIASKTRNSSKDMSKIVVLKPQISTQNSPYLSSESSYSKKFHKDSEKTLSHFSFREIKRKLRHIIGNSRKQQHLISKDSFSSIPIGYKGSANTFSVTYSTESTRTNITNQTIFNSENLNQSVPSNAEMNQQKLGNETAQCRIKGLSPVSIFRAESLDKENAEEHFSEMISTEYETANSTNNQISKFSEKPIFPSDCNLLKLQLIDNLSSNLVYKVSVQEESYNVEQFNKEGREEIVEMENVEYVHIINPTKKFNTLNMPDSSSFEFHKDGCSTPSEPGTPNEKPRILTSTSPNSLIINHFESSDFFIEKPERPSPVSVLEPFFLEDEASQDHPSTQLDALHRPIHLNFHEDSAVVIATSDYLIPHQRICSYDIEIITKSIRTLLETYSFDSEMSPDPSISHEMKSLQSSYPEDTKLLMDCVNEILSDIKHRQFQIFKPTEHQILKDFTIIEVCKTIKSYLSSQAQSTINEIMKKDMDSAMWLDHSLEMEFIVGEMSCNIFEVLMEDTIFEFFFFL